MKSLQNPWRTRLWRDSAKGREKFLFVFNDRKFELPNFSRTFLAEMGEFNGLRGKKFSFGVFQISRFPHVVRTPRLAGHRKGRASFATRFGFFRKILLSPASANGPVTQARARNG
jgi:hypothetical protein